MKMTLYTISIIILDIITIIQCSPIMIKYKENNESIIIIQYINIVGSINIDLNIGHEVQLDSVQINQELNYTWVSDLFYYVDTQSTQKVQNKMSIDGIEVEYIIKNDIFLFNHSTLSIDNINFFVFINGYKLYSYSTDSIGLGFKFDDENFSLVHIMKRNNLINKLSYSFIPNNNNSNSNNTTQSDGNISFGGIPLYILNKVKAKGKCNVISKENSWGCKLINVYLADSRKNNVIYSEYKIVNNNNYFKFQAIQGYTLIPYSFYDFICNKAINDLLRENNKCKKILTKDKKNFIKCSYEFKWGEDKKKIYFQFEEFTLEMQMLQLFTKEGEEEGELKSIFYTEENKEDHWIIGGYFVKYFITQFDYDNKAIYIYSSENNIFNNNENIAYKNEKRINYIIITDFLILLGIIVLLYALI